MKVIINNVDCFTFFPESDADHAILRNLNRKTMAVSYEEGEQATLYTTLTPTPINRLS